MCVSPPEQRIAKDKKGKRKRKATPSQKSLKAVRANNLKDLMQNQSPSRSTRHGKANTTNVQYNLMQTRESFTLTK